MKTHSSSRLALAAVCVLALSLYAGEAVAQQIGAVSADVVHVRGGDFVPVGGVLLPDGFAPHDPFDLTTASDERVRGWVASDEFMLDAATCFKGCPAKLKAERERADALTDAERVRCDAAMAAEQKRCSEYLDAQEHGCKSAWESGWPWLVGEVGLGATAATGLIIGLQSR